jgi:hypothetical protein
MQRRGNGIISEDGAAATGCAQPEREDPAPGKTSAAALGGPA